MLSKETIHILHAYSTFEQCINEEYQYLPIILEEKPFFPRSKEALYEYAVAILKDRVMISFIGSLSITFYDIPELGDPEFAFKYGVLWVNPLPMFERGWSSEDQQILYEYLLDHKKEANLAFRLDL